MASPSHGRAARSGGVREPVLITRIPMRMPIEVTRADLGIKTPSCFLVSVLCRIRLQVTREKSVFPVIKHEEGVSGTYKLIHFIR